MAELPIRLLETLRDALRSRGERRSVVLPSNNPAVIEVMEVLEEYGPFAEIMYLMATADHRLLNVEREVVKGSLDLLSKGRVRRAHMEAMLDASARHTAEIGAEACLKLAIDKLRDDPIRAEMTVILAAAVAMADDILSAEEQVIIDKLLEGFGISETRARQLLEQLSVSPTLVPRPLGEPGRS